MTYRTSHMGIDIELVRRVDYGPVEINITPSFVATGPGWQPAKIGTVYVNGNPMTDLESMDKDDMIALDKLRKTMELEETVIPHTVLTFAEVRIRRYEMELAKCIAALELAKESLFEITVDPTQYDFGPAYEGAKTRQAEALKAVKSILKGLK